MQVNNITNTTFNGAFRLQGLTPELKENARSVLKNKRQIFDNIGSTNDMVIVTRDAADALVHKFVKYNNIQFQYYPKINTKCGLDDEKPRELLELMKNSSFVTTNSQVKKIIGSKKRVTKLQSICDSYKNNILKTLCIDSDNTITLMKKGALIIQDKEHARKVIISPPSKYKIHYVSVVPDSKNVEIKRYAIDSDGNILSTFNTPEGIKNFINGFNKSLVNP